MNTAPLYIRESYLVITMSADVLAKPLAMLDIVFFFKKGLSFLKTLHWSVGFEKNKANDENPVI